MHSPDPALHPQEGAPKQTAALPIARSEDVSRRMKRYAIQMGIRMACFIALPFVPGWWKAVALAGAVLLPYIAVLLANDQVHSARRDPGPSIPQSRHLTAADHGAAPVLSGEIVAPPAPSRSGGSGPDSEGGHS